jgi:hypothetical protein
VAVKINPTILLIIFVLSGALIFAVIRSCNNHKEAIAADSKLTELSKKIVSDSIEFANTTKEYEVQSELQDGQIALKENQLQAKDDSLDAANLRILALISKHKPIKPSIDTNITTVPNEYVNDCEGCFMELTRGRDMVMSYKGTADSLRIAFLKKKRTDSIRIQGLTLRNADLTGTLADAISAAAAEREKTRPRAKGLISIGTLLINANLPNAIGGGFGYQDKYNRIFTVKYYASEYGSVKQVDVLIPLSFKRRR